MEESFWLEIEQAPKRALRSSKTRETTDFLSGDMGKLESILTGIGADASQR
jgi:hypothetical protein